MIDLNEILLQIRDKIADYKTGVNIYIDRSNSMRDEECITIWFDDINTWDGDEKGILLRFVVIYRFELSQTDDDFVESDAQMTAFDLWRYLITSDGVVISRADSQSVTCGYNSSESKDFYSVTMKFELRSTI
jgi:hypothetical protein